MSVFLERTDYARIDDTEQFPAQAVTRYGMEINYHGYDHNCMTANVASLKKCGDRSTSDLAFHGY